MLSTTTTPSQRRQAFRAGLASGRLQVLPGAFTPLSVRLIEDKGFDGAYISGAVMAAELGLPDIGLTTLSEVAHRAHQISRMSDLPTLVDADTGFGEPMNVARTVHELEDAGVAGLHLEDQVNPKRCGHLDGKAVVDTDTAVKRIKAAVDARRDPDLVIMARVTPDDRDRVSVGQAAQVRLSGLSRRSTPVLLGEVVTISGDRLTDRQSGEAYYDARIIIPEEQLGLLEDTAELVPGMPAEVMIETGERSALGYILSPLTDSLDRAFREYHRAHLTPSLSAPCCPFIWRGSKR